ncbi:c-type cytochrome [Oceanospirillum maris]|uniref:c-type cytochrome n=1 Tax=Oceanospirillum maris TaxID=64977 RepID=UPI00040C873F|nr:c-type cytochrome [Oceanospirillum maris]
MKTILSLLAISFASSVFAANELPDRQTELPAVKKAMDTDYLQPRSLDQVPETEFGKMVKLGYSLFVDSQQMRGEFVGNDQNCVNCHMQAGQKANAAPLWAAYSAYPAYRKKNDKVNSYAERIQGCFTYSMNGVPPTYDSEEIKALSAYSYWMMMGGLMDRHGMKGQAVPEVSAKHLQAGAKGADFPFPDKITKAFPVEDRSSLKGRGYPKLAQPEQTPSIERGSDVYSAYCSTCHSADGQGIRGNDGRSYIPPLWGASAYNWGAGMHRINTAAYFIYENMPLGKSATLTKQQAWDVAAYVNSHERPQDPRFKGDLQENRDKYHNHQGYYGQETNGKLLGKDSYPSATVDGQ